MAEGLIGGVHLPSGLPMKIFMALLLAVSTASCAQGYTPSLGSYPNTSQIYDYDLGAAEQLDRPRGMRE